jgi:hypothetical protein
MPPVIRYNGDTARYIDSFSGMGQESFGMKIGTLLEHIDLGQLALPEFQRGYVWNREQVRGLMNSLYRRHPVGGLLVWTTKVDESALRGNSMLPASGSVDLLLDGQQRITSLYGIVKGRPPQFFDGNPRAFTSLMFNMADQSFEFFAPVKMRDNPVWVDVTELMQTADITEIIEPRAERLAELELKPLPCMARLQRVQNIRDIEFHIERISGDEMTLDVVVDIFNRVNSGGTTLSKGDLALAKVCASWPEAREEMKQRLEKWERNGYGFRLDWLLRCVTTVTTGEAFFSALAKTDTERFALGLGEAERYIDTLLNTIAGRLGLDHGEVIGSVYSLPLLARYLHQHGGKLPAAKDRDKLLYWYIHTTLWGRYAGSTETVLSQDLRLIQDTDGALDSLIAQLRQNRGDLAVQPNDFLAWARGARFYSLLYMLTRVYHAKDLDSGLELRAQLLGHLMRLELHHIFPKAKLYKYGTYSKAEVNSLANFMFLTQETNIQISDEDPERYLTRYEEKNPGVLRSQWIPEDSRLWKYENYPEFLAARRELLAQAANEFLNSLYQGVVPEEGSAGEIPIEQGREIIDTAPPVARTDEEEILLGVSQWAEEQGLPEGEFYYQLVDPDTKEVLAVFDLAWPDGLQPGLSKPVALLIDEPDDMQAAANAAGYRYFTDVDAFTEYVVTEILDGEIAAD